MVMDELKDSTRFRIIGTDTFRECIQETAQRLNLPVPKVRGVINYFIHALAYCIHFGIPVRVGAFGVFRIKKIRKGYIDARSGNIGSDEFREIVHSRIDIDDERVQEVEKIETK